MKKFSIITLLAFIFALNADQTTDLHKVYKDNTSLVQGWAKESLANLHINANDKILDLGCGDGSITALVAKTASSGAVIGMDTSDDSIATAAKKNTADNLLFFVTSTENFSYNGQFDKIVSFCALPWVKDQKSMLKSMRDSLSKGGQILIVTYGQSINNLGSLIDSLAVSANWTNYFPNYKSKTNYLSELEYKNLLQNVKLTPDSITSSDSAVTYKNRKDLVHYLSSVVNVADQLSNKLQAQFISDLADAVITNSKSADDGSIAVIWTKLEIIAHK